MVPKSFLIITFLFFIIYQRGSGQQRQPVRTGDTTIAPHADTTKAPQADTLLVPQKDIIDLIFKLTHWGNGGKDRENKKILFSIVPLAGAGSGGSQVAVSSVNAAFYLGTPATTNISNIYFVPYTNFSNRVGFVINPNVWLDKNRWNLTGELRIANNALNTYGLGGNTSKDSLDEIDYQYIRVYVNVDRRVAGAFYMGVGYNLDYFYNLKEVWPYDHPSEFAQYGIGTGPQTTSTGIAFDLLWDSRKNSINSTGGYYSKLIYRINPGFLANDYHWTSLYSDNRAFISLNNRRKGVLAFWGLYWASFGNTPYLNLPGTELDLNARTGRGYVWGRYRGKQMLYGETEYRFNLSPNGFWGGTVFANVQSFQESLSNRFEYVNPAAGIGLRIKFNKRSNTNLTIDLAAGKNSFNAYLNLGEYF